MSESNEENSILYSQSGECPQIIKEINAIKTVETGGGRFSGYTTTYGYSVVTNNDICKFMKATISPGQSCCEIYGAHITDNILNETETHGEFDVEKYIGATILDVEYKVSFNSDYSSSDGYVNIFVNTTNGKFLITLYNENNRHYDHDYQITINGITLISDSI